ncbi:MAG: peptidylprolyl isomerase, partial [Clostridia bacterium]|nr:peptidylprolyl isomerase [Clostridia bacterium]
MNKKLTSILALALTLVIVFSLAACSEVEYGSKVQKMNMVLSYADADGNTVERTVKIKLYENLAPKTVAHFIDLAQKGYYDGTVVSNLQSGWFEIGGYKSVNGVFEACDKDVATVEGEFSVNGWLNNPLKSSNVGALIMKRNYSLDTDAVHPYDTAKATVIVTTASASKFNSTEYCYFGLVVSDDDNYVVTSADTEYKKTSLDACKALADYRVKDGATVYYYELTGEYY